MRPHLVTMTACMLAALPLAVAAQSNSSSQGSPQSSGSSMSSSTTDSPGNSYGGMRNSKNWEQTHRASKIIGTDVVNRQGDKIGDVEDVVLDSRGNVAYAVVSTGGFLGVGERWHAVPWRALNTTDRSGNFVLDIDRNRLSQAPGFTRDNWPNVNDPKWTSQNSRYFGHSGMSGADSSGDSTGTGAAGSGMSGSGMSGGGMSGAGTSGRSGSGPAGSGMSGNMGTGGSTGSGSNPGTGSSSGSGSTGGSSSGSTR